MHKTIKKLVYILIIGFSFFTNELFAANFIDGIRWVKVFNDRLNGNIAVTTNVIGLDSEKYSCGDHCQLIKLMTNYASDHGELIINLHNTKCASHTSVSIPFAMEDEDLNTPITTYDIAMAGGYCQKAYIKADVTGNPDSVFGYKIALIS